MSTRAQHRHLYTGDYQARARTICDRAAADPTTRCQAPGCGRTLNQHPPTRTGNPPTWSAGHAWPNDPDAPLVPQVLACNIAERNTRHNGSVNTHSENF